MKDEELPNSSKSKVVKKFHTELPPQESAFDTSNWENRNVGAVTFDTGMKERTVRMVDFMLAETLPLGITREQAEKIIKQRLSESNDATKSSK